jgi:SAM-dependent methyltransferase
MKAKKETWDAVWKETSADGKPNYRIVQEIERLCPDLRGKKILEVGAGTGVDSIYLARKGADVVALDFSPESIKLMKRNAPKGRSFSIVQADAYNMPFADNSFDVVFSQGFVEHFTNPKPLVLEQRRVLKNDGYLIIDVPQTFSLYTVEKKLRLLFKRWPPGWETQFSALLLKRLGEECGLRLVSVYGRDFFPFLLTPTGRLRRFMPGALAKAHSKMYGLFERSRMFKFLSLSVGGVFRKR